MLKINYELLLSYLGGLIGMSIIAFNLELLGYVILIVGAFYAKFILIYHALKFYK